jgi:hypothetical protein
MTMRIWRSRHFQTLMLNLVGRVRDQPGHAGAQWGQCYRRRIGPRASSAYELADIEAAELDRLITMGVPVPGIEIRVDKHIARVWLSSCGPSARSAGTRGRSMGPMLSPPNWASSIISTLRLRSWIVLSQWVFLSLALRSGWTSILPVYGLRLLPVGRATKRRILMNRAICPQASDGLNGPFNYNTALEAHA